MASAYVEQLCAAMSLVAEHPRSVFMGQAVAHDGTGMRQTLKHLPPEKLLEMPVAEDMQLGMATGMAIAGDLPVCIFPRWSFLLLATNQLALHLDKLALYSNGEFRPRVIIRTAVPTPYPLDPGPQHLGDFTEACRRMLTRVRIVRLSEPSAIVLEYEEAMQHNGSTILVEYAAAYA